MSVPTVPFATQRVLARLTGDVRPDSGLVRLIYSEKAPDAPSDAPFTVRGAMEFPTTVLADAIAVLQAIAAQLVPAVATAPAPPPEPAIDDPALSPADKELAWALGLPVSDLQPGQRRRRKNS